MHITIVLPEKPVQDTRECEMEEISDSIYRETAPASYCQACINMAVCASRSCKWCSFQLTNLYILFLRLVRCAVLLQVYARMNFLVVLLNQFRCLNVKYFQR